MKDTSATNAKSVLLTLLFAFCLACSVFILMVAYRFSAASFQLWRGSYTVLVSADIPVASVEHRLTIAGLSAIAAGNSTVRFDDFSSETKVPLARLAMRLDPLDPRYDPYMRSLESFFRTGQWNIFYVKMSSPPALAVAILGHALRGMRWKTADLNRKASLLCLPLLALVSLSTLFRVRRPRAATLVLSAGLLPWLPFAINGSYIGTLAASLILLGWSAAVDIAFPLFRYYLEYRVLETERLPALSAIMVSALFASVLFAGIDARLVDSLVRGSGFLLSLSAGLAAYELVRRERRQHRLFFPLRIYDGLASRHRSPRGAARAAWVAVVLLASPAIAFVDWSGGVDIPTPVVYPGVARNSWSALGKVWRSRGEHGLPNLADYVAHRAYQAGLSFGAAYAFPRPGDRLYELHYTREGERIARTRVVVKVYTQDWFHRILADADGVPRLIQEQPGVVLPTRDPLYGTRYPASYFGIFWLAAFVVFLPSSFLRRGTAFQTVGRSAALVSVVPSPVPISARRLPSRPPRRRSITETRGLVSEAVSDGER